MSSLKAQQPVPVRHKQLASLPGRCRHTAARSRTALPSLLLVLVQPACQQAYWGLLLAQWMQAGAGTRRLLAPEHGQQAQLLLLVLLVPQGRLSCPPGQARLELLCRA